MRIWKLISDFFKKMMGTGTGTVVVKVKCHEKYPHAPMPVKAHTSDAGADLYCVEVEYDDVFSAYTLHSGLCFEIPEGYVGSLFPRSSIYKTGMDMTNCVGVIDSNYEVR